jgi:hypothetical protein
MPRCVLLAATVAIVLVSVRAQAQSRPDFSGKWTLTAKPGGLRTCAESLTLLQDQSTLRIHSGDDASRASVHGFDGADMRKTLAPPPARPAGLSPDAFEGHQTRFVARAAWNGDQFVVVTHATMTMTWPNRLPGEFDRETTAKAVYSFSEAGQLVVEHIVLIDPLPGGSTRRLDLPDSWTCAYAKTGPPNPASVSK